MVRRRLWLALALGAALVAPGPRPWAQEISEAPETGASEAEAPEIEPSVPRLRDPPVIWTEVMMVRDEIHYYTDAEELETVVELAGQLNRLKQEFHISILNQMDLSTRAKREDPARREDVVEVVKIERALNFMYVISRRLATAAATGIPDRVRELYGDLDYHLSVVQHWVPEKFLTGEAPPSES
jgi:hypothetical protein